eukprot:c23400_g1_i2 orf=144-545(+)
MGSTAGAGQRGAAEAGASSPTRADTFCAKFTAEELQVLSGAAGRLEKVALIGQVPGRFPSRQEIRDWLQGSLAGEGSRIRDISLLGRGFFQVELDSAETMQRLLGLSPLHFEGRFLFLLPWTQGFSSDTIRDL